MTIETYYVADDGTKFLNENDCWYHEKIECTLTDKFKLKFLDKTGNTIPVNNYRSFYNAITDCDYIIMNLPQGTAEEINAFISALFPNNDKGAFWFDDYEECWTPIEERYNMLKEQIEILQKILKEG